MAYDFEEASDQRITYLPNADYTTKVSIHAWIWFESLTAGHQMHFVDKGKNDAGNDRNFSLYWTPADSGRVGVSWYGPVGTEHTWRSSTANNPSTGVWHDFYAEVDWTTNPDTVLMWIDGSPVTLTLAIGSNNTTPTTGATQQLSIGAEHGSASNNNEHDGLLAEVGVWSDIMGDARAIPLSKGFSPAFFQNNLGEYVPLIRNLNNLKGGTGTPSASAPVVAAHPKIIYPSINDISTYTAQAPAVTSTIGWRNLLGVGI